MNKCLFAAAIAATVITTALSAQNNLSGADESTPSRSVYFTWINHSFEGPTEETVRAGLDFFRYLKETYGMQLDIFSIEAGAIDGWNFYDTIDSERVKKHFPNGFGELAKFAEQDGTKLGMWCGPDGFGDTDWSARKRIEMMVSLVRDYNFGLFKMDACCSNLDPKNAVWFEKMMSQVREISPDFVLLNHRIDLGEATKYATTYLFEGLETYVDVHMANKITAPHHREGNMERVTPPTRLTEDHGVCLSSCMDFWEDDLILQAFNRDLILSPQIYGNPWLLRDDEFSKLAFIYNLHRDYRDIMVNGTSLPEDKYGLHAMSRGDGKTRLITLRNLSWKPVTYHVNISNEIGLDPAAKVKVRMYHPYIYDMGSYAYGTDVDVTVLPFRSCLVKLTSAPEKDPVTVSGIPYQIVNDRVGSEAQVKLLGKPGETYKYKIAKGRKSSTKTITFPGEKNDADPFRHISSMEVCDIPADASSIYYATIYAADNNALELRTLKRSGETAIPQVQAARDAFFNQERFIGRSLSDRHLFDGNPDTSFDVAMRWDDVRCFGNSMFTLDFGESVSLDKLVISTDSEYSLGYQKLEQAVYVYVSDDLVNWKTLSFISAIDSELDMSTAGSVRYLRFMDCPLRISEVTGYKDGKKVCSDKWRASNLFVPFGDWRMNPKKAWKSEFVLDEIPENSYLCVAINGRFGTEHAWAGFKIDGKYVGCPDRSPSYPSNTFECPARRTDSNYTYYLPLTPDMKGKKIEAWTFVMSYSNYASDIAAIKPEIWMSNYPHPFKEQIINY